MPLKKGNCLKNQNEKIVPDKSYHAVKQPFVFGSSHRGAAETRLTRNHEVAGLIPGLARWAKDSALPQAVV